MGRATQRFRLESRAYHEGLIAQEVYHKICQEISDSFLSENTVYSEDHGDAVNVWAETEDMCVSIWLSILEDRGVPYVAIEGEGMLEFDSGNEYWIAEDVTLNAEIVEQNLPNVARNRREAIKEERARRREYRNSVL